MEDELVVLMRDETENFNFFSFLIFLYFPSIRCCKLIYTCG